MRYTQRMKKPQQKKQLSQVKWQFWLVALGILIVAGVMLSDNSWVQRNYHRLSVERTIHKELKPLKAPLEALGFTDLDNLDTQCTKPAADPSIGPSDDDWDCSASINRYVKVPADKIAFNQHAETLSKALQANGWKSREDLPTIPWFQKISQNVDYQPDQLNTKQIGDMACTIDFYTAYSKPQAPAISLRAACDTPRSQSSGFQLD